MRSNVAIFIVMSCLVLYYADQLDEYGTLVGTTMSKVQQMKQDCEKDLPRSQQCVIVVSAQITKEKE